jgi:hypothetical protein
MQFRASSPSPVRGLPPADRQRLEVCMREGRPLPPTQDPPEMVADTTMYAE